MSHVFIHKATISLEMILKSSCKLVFKAARSRWKGDKKFFWMFVVGENLIKAVFEAELLIKVYLIRIENIFECIGTKIKAKFSFEFNLF